MYHIILFNFRHAKIFIKNNYKCKIWYVWVFKIKEFILLLKTVFLRIVEKKNAELDPNHGKLTCLATTDRGTYRL